MLQGLSNCCRLRESSPSLGQSLGFARARAGAAASPLQLLVIELGFIQAMAEASPPSYRDSGVLQLSIGVSAPSWHR